MKKVYQIYILTCSINPFIFKIFKSISHDNTVFIFLNCCPGSNYTTCISSQKKTCLGNAYATDEVIGYSECVKQCNQDPNCNFLFFIPDNSKNCLRYDSCDKLRGATFCGSTYSKHGYCSGRICNST